jgi:hypothetical protein
VQFATNTDKTKSGWIIQHFKKTVEWWDKDGNPITPPAEDGSEEYWKAWGVANGAPYNGIHKDLPHASDTWTIPDYPKVAKGKITITGSVKFIENYYLDYVEIPGAEKPQWSTTAVPHSGGLPATRTRPTGWDDAGAITRTMVIEWDDCAKPPEATKVTSTPDPWP